MRALMTGALDKAAMLGGDRANAVAMGYCFGGAAVLEMARSGADLKGFATFHGGLKTPKGQSYENTKGEILVMHGTADTAITMEQFAGLAANLKQKASSMKWLPTAVHRMPLPSLAVVDIGKMPI